MNKSNRVNHQDRSDQQLIDLFGQLKDREAIVELYERYRVSVGRYLYKDIKSKKTVLDIFNSMIMHLVNSPSSQACERNVSVKLFSMAYKRRSKYITKSIVQRGAVDTRDDTEPENELAVLSRFHKDVIELVYKNNFAIDEVAEITGRSPSAIRNCLSYIKNHPLLFDCSNSPTMAMLSDSTSSTSKNRQKKETKELEIRL